MDSDFIRILAVSSNAKRVIQPSRSKVSRMHATAHAILLEATENTNSYILIVFLTRWGIFSNAYLFTRMFLKFAISDSSSSQSIKTFFWFITIILNFSIDTLHTRTILHIWRKRSSDQCKRYGWKETLGHILWACRKSLDERRFTYRHNSILKPITSLIDAKKNRILTDIAGHTTYVVGTIRPEVLITNETPDLVVIDGEEKIMNIIELTVPWEERLEESRRLKTDKYAPIVSGWIKTGYKIRCIPLEMGVRIIIKKENQRTIQKITKYHS